MNKDEGMRLYWVKIIFLNSRIVICALNLLSLSQGFLFAQNEYAIEYLDEDSIYSTSLGYFNTSPENSTGNKAIYVKYRNAVEEEYEEILSGSLMLYDFEQQKRYVITTIDSLFGYHNGAHQLWVNDQIIAYMDGHYIHSIDVDSGKKWHQPFKGLIGHNANSGEILYALNEQIERKETGIYSYDVSKNKHVLIKSLKALHQELSSHFSSDGLKLEEWYIRHLQWSPSGKYIAFRLDIKNSKNEGDRMLVSIDSSGQNVVVFGKKPMHFLWYDDHSFFGFDHQVEDGLDDDRTLRRWDRHGHCIENLAGIGCHLAGSSNRNYFASESWYGSNPVQLKLFKRHHIDPIEIVFSTHLVDVIWAKRAHVNPTFGNSGRLYFHIPISETAFHVAFKDYNHLDLK